MSIWYNIGGIITRLTAREHAAIGGLLQLYADPALVDAELEARQAAADIGTHARAASRPPRQRRSSSSPAVGSTPSPRQTRSRRLISTAAAASRAWCRTLKAIPLADLPAFAPPRSAFDNLGIPRRDLPSGYDPAHASTFQPVDNHPHLAVAEQRFLTGFQGRLSEAQYLECKARIFACHRWRTEEDGLHHNIESSQQCCAMNVKMVTVIHRWFDSAHFFDKAWNEADTSQRPPQLGTLWWATEGRNGREVRPKVMNIPRRFV